MPVTPGRRAPSALYTLPLLVLAITLPARAEVYTWQDDSGQTQFSDRPPESRDYQRWEPPENPNSDLQMPEPRERSSVVTRDDEDEEGDSGGSRSEESRQEEQCRQYEAKLERIDNQLRAGYREPKGNRLRAKRRRLRSKRFHECM